MAQLKQHINLTARQQSKDTTKVRSTEEDQRLKERKIAKLQRELDQKHQLVAASAEEGSVMATMINSLGSGNATVESRTIKENDAKGT